VVAIEIFNLENRTSLLLVDELDHAWITEREAEAEVVSSIPTEAVIIFVARKVDPVILDIDEIVALGVV
jgi:hypothetical protein